MPEKLPVTVSFGGYTCNAYRDRYPEGGATAIYLTDIRDDEPLATATVKSPRRIPSLG